MFENMSYLALQQYWWVIISFLASLLVFLMFVQGGQTLIYTIGKTEIERKLLVNSLGRKWEFTFTTLVTFGGAFFASFPLFYSTSFGGAYWVWMCILFCFILQAVAYEFRSKPDNIFGSKTYETFLFINGAFGTFLIGVAVATFFTGSQFSINEMNFSKWESSYKGLEAITNLHNILLGVTVFFLARVLGILYFINNINDNEILVKSKKQLIYNSIPFVFFFISFSIWLLIRDGFAYDPNTKNVFIEPYKYFNNFMHMPLIAFMFIIGVILVLWGIIKSIIKQAYKHGIWFTGIGAILVVFSLFIIAGFNNTAYYPSTFNLQSSLTIENSSSSKYTLKIMSYVSLFIPVVITYIVFAWRAINKKQIDKDEFKTGFHSY